MSIVSSITNAWHKWKNVSPVEKTQTNEEQKKVLQEEIQMLVLQSQINPHFLYNTLEAIRSEALVNGQHDLADMIESLGLFFRYNISQKGKQVTLREEIYSIENYFKIQKYRFDDRINLQINCSKDEYLNYRMPKLVLQPIVENCIYHGLEPKVGKGLVEINIWATAQRLIIEVSDDGVGIEHSKLSEMKKKILTSIIEPEVNLLKDNVLQDYGGIALRNVNQRIKLYFGMEYGLQIESYPGLGTDIELSLPLID